MSKVLLLIVCVFTLESCSSIMHTDHHRAPMHRRVPTDNLAKMHQVGNYELQVKKHATKLIARQYENIYDHYRARSVSQARFKPSGHIKRMPEGNSQEISLHKTHKQSASKHSKWLKKKKLSKKIVHKVKVKCCECKDDDIHSLFKNRPRHKTVPQYEATSQSHAEKEVKKKDPGMAITVQRGKEALDAIKKQEDLIEQATQELKEAPTHQAEPTDKSTKEFHEDKMPMPSKKEEDKITPKASKEPKERPDTTFKKQPSVSNSDVHKEGLLAKDSELTKEQMENILGESDDAMSESSNMKKSQPPKLNMKNIPTRNAPIKKPTKKTKAPAAEPKPATEIDPPTMPKLDSKAVETPKKKEGFFSKMYDKVFDSSKKDDTPNKEKQSDTPPPISLPSPKFGSGLDDDASDNYQQELKEKIINYMKSKVNTILSLIKK